METNPGFSDTKVVTSHHHFHIPVMGTGFTVDTPIRLAPLGITSVVSIGDDHLLEEMREVHSSANGLPFEPILLGEHGRRERRITAYLNLLGDLVRRGFENVRRAPFESGSPLWRYLNLLPPGPIRSTFLAAQTQVDPMVKAALVDSLRAQIVPGFIDVNIMAGVDGKPETESSGDPRYAGYACTALRGFAESRLNSSVVLSAGLNRVLLDYIATFPDFFPREGRAPQKRIIIKANDFRSARIQSKLLSRKGLWPSEIRIESGVNCGGHAFSASGSLMGPVLEEFRRQLPGLVEQLREQFQDGLRLAGVEEWLPPGIRLSAQGGVGTYEEHESLRKSYGLASVGWGTPFLLVPEATNVDLGHLKKLASAGESDVELTSRSPLGVPFWALKGSGANEDRLNRLERGIPGVPCTKGFLKRKTGSGRGPTCRASRGYQVLKLRELSLSTLPTLDLVQAQRALVDPICLCRALAAGALARTGLAGSRFSEVCCGPNISSFQGVYALEELVNHIYGRRPLRMRQGRIHMFLREVQLQIKHLKTQKEKLVGGLDLADGSVLLSATKNLLNGLAYYREAVGSLIRERRSAFLATIEELEAEISSLVGSPVRAEAPVRG